MKQKVIIVVLLIFSTFLWSVEHDYYDDQFLRIFEVVKSNNPELSALSKKVSGSGIKKYAAVFPADPMIDAMIGSMGITLAVEQKLKDPVVYIAGYMKENAAHLTAKALYEKKKGVILFELKKTYLDIYAIAEKIRILQKNIEIIGQLEDQILSKLQTGAMLENKIIMLQIEKEKLKDRLFTAQNQLEIKKSNLYAITGKQVDLITEISIRESNPGHLLSAFTDQSHLLAPEFLLSTANAKLMQAMNTAEIAKAIPDTSVGMEMGFNYMGSTTSMPMLMVMSSVPLYFPKNILGVTGTAKQRQASRDLIKNTDNRLKAKLNEILIKIDDSQRSYDLYKAVLKDKAQQNLDQVIAQFAVNENYSITIVLEAFRQVIAVDLMILDLQVKRELSLATLEKFFGKELAVLKKIFQAKEQ